MNATKHWYLQLVEFNHDANEVYTIGGAGWPTRASRDAAWASITEHQDDDATYAVDLLSDDGWSIEDTKLVTVDVAARLIADGDLNKLHEFGVAARAAEAVMREAEAS